MPVSVHGDLNVPVRPAQAHIDTAARRRELDGVREQVPDDLPQPVRIAGEGAHRCIDVAFDDDPLAVGRRHDGPDGVFDDLLDVHGLHLEARLPRDDARHVEDVFDDLRERAGIPLHHFDGVCGALGRRPRRTRSILA